MASQPAPLTVNALLYRKLNYDRRVRADCDQRPRSPTR
jgi:hypothetical protein